MTTKVVALLKYAVLFASVFLVMISCEKDIESVGVNLVDNNTFSSDSFVSEVNSVSENIEKVPANGLEQYLLGVYADEEFGKLKASIVTQLFLPAVADSYDYGTNAAIDSVIVSIPYQSTKNIENFSDGKPQFTIDSVIGDSETEFKLQVYELKTFLNTLDPTDPSKNAIYYSDKQFLKGDIPLYSGNFKINPNDTVSYIKRYLTNGAVYDIDTVYADDLAPSIKIPLDEDQIKTIFLDNASDPAFDSFDNFYHYFRGFYFEASELANEKSHIVSLSTAGSKMTIYYSKDEDEPTDEDLNNNGVNGETGVRTKHSFDFAFGNIKSNILERDYTNSKQSGTDRLYIQGAAGSLATVDLFINDDLNELRSKNWLITEANLIFYVDQNASSNIAPERIFLYNFEENLQLLDVFSEGIDEMGGFLEYDDEGKPYRYVVKITDYISELLKSDEPLNLVKLGIKVFNPSDAPTTVSDTKVRELSWNPKGVVLYNNNPAAGDKRLKLQIFYSELN